MELSTLIGECFEHCSINEKEKHRWSITNYNDRTKYVYVERPDGKDKIGQWIPAEWVVQLLAPAKFERKLDAMRKSRDYYKNERNEIHQRLVDATKKNSERDASLRDEMDFLRSELLIAENGASFWKSFSVYYVVASIILLLALWFSKIIFC